MLSLGKDELDDGDDGQHGTGLGKDDTSTCRGQPEQSDGAGAGAEAEQADQQYGVGTGDAQFAEAVGNMAVVTNVKRLPVFQAYEDDHDRIEQGDTQHQQWDQHGGDGLAFAGKVKGCQDTDDGQAVAEKVASSISHEDFGGGAVVEQETQRAATSGCGEHGDEMLLPKGCDQQQVHGCNHCRAASQPIHIVEKIQGIDDGHDPEHGDDPAENLVADAERQSRSPGGCNRGNHKLQKELFSCPHWFSVIHNSKKGDQSGSCRDQGQIFPGCQANCRV